MTIRRSFIGILVIAMIATTLQNSAVFVYAAEVESVLADDKSSDELSIETLADQAVSDIQYDSFVGDDKVETTGEISDVMQQGYISQDNNHTEESSEIYEDEAAEEIFPDTSGDYVSGSYGDVTWSINYSGLLTIKGEGNYKPEGDSESPWYPYKNQIKSAKVDLKNTTRVDKMFYYCHSLKTVDLRNFDTSQVTDMSGMFDFCTSLTTLDLRGLDTSSVTNMSGMFRDCISLTEINLSGLDTSNVTNMSSLFNGCKELTNINLSNLDTSNVTNMSRMFYECSCLTQLNLSSFNTSKVTDMRYMFGCCYGITEIDLSNINTSNVTNMSGMFKGCSGLTEIDLSSMDTSCVTDMGYMFCGCSGLAEIDLNGLDTSNVTSMLFMFEFCDGITKFDLSCIDTSNVTNMCGIFSYSGITGIDLNSIDTSNVKDMSGMFQGCSGLTEIDLSGLNTSSATYMRGMFKYCDGLTEINLGSLGKLNVTNMSEMLCDCTGLKKIDLKGLDISKMTDISGMFSGCSGLTEIDLNGLDTWKVTNMSYMFNGCSGLTEIDLSSIDTSYVSYMNYMFAGCKSLTALDLSSFNTSNVREMYSMFDGCDNLTTLDASGWDISKIEFADSIFSGISSLKTLKITGLNTSKSDNMSYMFAGCSGLTALDLSSLDTSNVMYMHLMFSGCSSLTTLDLSGLETSNVEDMDYMFVECSSLTTLDLSSLDTSNVYSMTGMLGGCTALKSIKSPKNLRHKIDLPDGDWTNTATGEKVSVIAENTAPGTLFIEAGYIPTNEVDISESSLEIVLGEQETVVLAATVLPDNATNKKAIWSSDNPNIATVDASGRITAVSVGTAIITVKTEDAGVMDTCTVTVKDSVIEIKTVIGQKINLSAIGFPYVTEAISRFVVDDKTLASISKEMLAGKKTGVVTVTAQKLIGKNEYENVGKCTVTILSKPQLKFNKQMTYIGQTFNAIDFFLTDDVKTLGATYWESSKPGIVEVTDAKTGTLEAKGTGTAKITAYFGEKGKPGTYKVSATIAVKIPSFQKSEYTMPTGGKLTLAMKNVNATLNPEWVTERSGIISATPQTDKKGNKTGKVILEGLTYGDTKLIATIDGQEYECTVHVTKPVINKTTMELKVGKTGALSLKNTKIKKQDIVWTSEDPSIATVDSSGKVKVVSSGITVIYTEAGGVRNECIVTVK